MEQKQCSRSDDARRIEGQDQGAGLINANDTHESSTLPRPNRVRAYEVNVKGTDWPKMINHVSAAKAKYQYLIDVRESWPSVGFKDLTCRVIGGPASSEQFIRCAAGRGLPNARCGDRVRVGNGTGTIVGHNSSANFDVLFDPCSPEYPGLTLNCHPKGIEFLGSGTSTRSANSAATRPMSPAQKNLSAGSALPTTEDGQ